MRQSYLSILPSLRLAQHLNKQQTVTEDELYSILDNNADNPNELFFQVLASLYLLQSKDHKNQSTNNSKSKQKLQKVLLLPKLAILQKNYRGSYSIFVLKIHALTHYLATSPESLSYHWPLFPVLKAFHHFKNKNIDSKQPFNILNIVSTSIEKGLFNYQSYILYLQFIALDLLNLLYKNSKNIDLASLVEFTKISLPKILSNIILPKNLFPNTLIQSSKLDECIDILYANQFLQNTVKMCENYHRLMHKIIIQLLQRINEDCPPALTKQLVSFSFRYYYLYHKLEAEVAEFIVINSLLKMSNAVQFALHDQIFVFFLILRKLGQQRFIKELMDKFEWSRNIFETRAARGIKKQAIMPFYSRALGKIQQITIPSRSIQRRYIQIYDRFSIFYFSLKCIEYDIRVSLYYIGSFDKPIGSSNPQLLFSLQKDDIYEGSLQILQPGIYMFELDNTFSWVHSKNIVYDICILSPLQIIQSDQVTQMTKQIVFCQSRSLNSCSIDKLVGHMHEKQLKFEAGVANLRRIEQQSNKDMVVYNMKITRNSGRIYEYESSDKSLYKQKIQEIFRKQGDSLLWKIQGYNISQNFDFTHQNPTSVPLNKILTKISDWIDLVYNPKTILETRKLQYKKNRKNPFKRFDELHKGGIATQKQIQMQRMSEQQCSSAQLQTNTEQQHEMSNKEKQIAQNQSAKEQEQENGEVSK